MIMFPNIGRPIILTWNQAKCRFFFFFDWTQVKKKFNGRSEFSQTHLTYYMIKISIFL